MAIATLTELPGWARALLAEARVAHLGLLDPDGRPRVLPVTFEIAEDVVWSAVDRKPKRSPDRELARVRFLRRDPRAALTVDRYSDRWDELAWVQILGDVRIVATDDEDSGAPLDRLAAKYPQYRYSTPPGPLLALDPQRCLYWRAGGPAG